MSFPVHDWQFWVATALALAAVLWMVRSLLRLTPWGRRKARERGRRAELTIGGRNIRRE